MAEQGSPVVVGQDRIPWDISKAIIALRSIGYSFEQAVADIIDNSVDAGACVVLVRFSVKKNGALSLAIVDDGGGMDATILKEAMRIGSRTEPARHHLGKYGLGLKLATFSHAKSLTVHTRNNNCLHGRRLTIDGIKTGGLCDRLAEHESKRVLSTDWGPVPITSQGTVVVWDQVDRITFERSNLEKLIKKVRTRLQLHLGMCFHRHISDGRLRIYHDRQNDGVPINDMAVEVKSLDPGLSSCQC